MKQLISQLNVYEELPHNEMYDLIEYLKKERISTEIAENLVQHSLFKTINSQTTMDQRIKGSKDQRIKGINDYTKLHFFRNQIFLHTKKKKLQQS